MLLSMSVLLFHPVLQTGFAEPLLHKETPGVSCEGGGSFLTWYLNGVKQEGVLGKEPPYLVPVAPGSSSVLTLRESGENCSESSQKGEELLRVHFPPESAATSTRAPGLSMLLFLVVRTQPHSSLNLQDHDERLILNSSRLLLLDTHNVDGNGSLRVRVSTEESGVSHASVTAMGFLSTQVQLPLLVLVFGGCGMVAGILLVNIIVCCLLMRRRTRNYAVKNQLILSPSNNMKLNNSCLPREHMSLPSNLQLNDLRPQAIGLSDVSVGDTQEDVSARCAALANTGFDRFPLVGYIYKANSVSSDEIWL
ncbi:transmembrane protein 25 [Bombina bombina]|uniref:transmembrane protein 25 n=1 Tax=Bombina bombina TaxID=8345 RepID=UPI00235A824C|nr:transmembrane protein 25 [Bombina bombina]XP_053547317.1 transmembrane protein 25 [Bombina bombina]